MHLVHYKNDYSSVSDAAASNESDALAVLGFLFEVSSGTGRSHCAIYLNQVNNGFTVK